MKGRQSGMPEETSWNNFFDAECILESLDCSKSSGDVIDFGCGYGLFTVSAARLTCGNVYAFDIDAEMVEVTRAKAAEAGLANVHVEQRDFVADGCGRPGESAGYVMLFNILHIEDPGVLLREAHRVLTPGGKLAIIHWNYDPTTPRGPSMDIRPRPEQCRAWAEQAGFQWTRLEPLECCPYHYGLLLEKPLARVA